MTKCHAHNKHQKEIKYTPPNDITCLSNSFFWGISMPIIVPEMGNMLFLFPCENTEVTETMTHSLINYYGLNVLLMVAMLAWCPHMIADISKNIIQVKAYV